MALPFSCLIVPCFIFCFFPNLSCACPSNNLTCGGASIEIWPPFHTNTTPIDTDTTSECRGYHMISCNHSTPIVQFNGYGPSYIVKNIDYAHRSIIIQDQEFSKYVQISDCTFLYKFHPPIPLFETSFLPQSVSPSQSLFNCRPNDGYDICTDIFHELYDRNICRGYDLYFSNKSEDEGSGHNKCWAGPSPSFGWTLLFTDDGDLYLQFAAYYSDPSQIDLDWHLGWGCFKHNNTGDSTFLCNDQYCHGNNDAKSKIPVDPAGKSNARRKIAIGSISAMITAGLLFSCYFFLLAPHRCRNLLKLVIFWRSKSNNAQNIEEFLGNYGSLAPKRFKYSDLKKITNSFHDKIGEGGYGIVYKGSLQGGRLVAVKFLRNSRGDGEEFVNEVVSIGRTSHVNVVSLIGFCLEGSKRALIYDYMPNGSLEKYIYSEKPRTTLGWEKLYEIAIGIARGLEYLHRGSNTRIVHFDIKPHNILLDQDFCPKIADFGLAKLCPPKDSILSVTCARGTIGFIAPEVFSRNFGVVSTKSDVYSYGMMVLEMVGGRKNVKNQKNLQKR
ncbi:LEAF RUST 10 DISEASE-RESISTANCEUS RECEPTOR-LIKE PROTEIN KINASE-like 2.7 isoform X2 [Elaeis guineensis]|uniref:LEAF RUST 10 DISEASE-RESISTANCEUS RECEPTOR-LIKE PROTEIN KINASE-like 2.7 isoform X2 n=1 Tax=Elaeis guineensis var. tenera TaxID=51953 RepID=UPI003C6D1414